VRRRGAVGAGAGSGRKPCAAAKRGQRVSGSARGTDGVGVRVVSGVRGRGLAVRKQQPPQQTNRLWPVVLFQEDSRDSRGCWPPRLAVIACPLWLTPRENPPHRAGRLNGWAPGGGVLPADIDSKSSRTRGTRPGYDRAACPIPISGAREAHPPLSRVAVRDSTLRAVRREGTS
jgi:hypothetical protein